MDEVLRQEIKSDLVAVVKLFESKLDQLEAKLNKYQETELEHASFSERYIQDLEQFYWEKFEKIDIEFSKQAKKIEELGKRIDHLDKDIDKPEVINKNECCGIPSSKPCGCDKSPIYNVEFREGKVGTIKPKDRVEMPKTYIIDESGYIKFKCDYGNSLGSRMYCNIWVNKNTEIFGINGKEFNKQQFQQLINDMQQLLDESK